MGRFRITNCMLKKILILLVIVLSLLGIVDAGYITYEKLSGNIPPCNSIFSCGEVLESKYASVGPIPLSAFGLVFYLTFLGLSSWYLLNLDTQGSARESKIRLAILVLGGSGFGFSLYLLFLMGVVLQAWCFYCLLSAVNCVGLFCSSLALQVVARRPETSI